jgi:hypothetical protein
MKTEQQLDEAIARLSRDITPATDLWPAISAQLTQQQSLQQTPPLVRPQTADKQVQPYWWASAAAILLAVSVWLQWPANHLDSGQTAALHAPVTGSSVAVDYGLLESQRHIRQAEKLQLMQLKQIPAGFANWQQQLAIWQQASEQVTLALATDPNNLKLIRKLNLLQQQQLNYIRKLVDTSQLS